MVPLSCRFCCSSIFHCQTCHCISQDPVLGWICDAAPSFMLHSSGHHELRHCIILVWPCLVFNDPRACTSVNHIQCYWLIYHHTFAVSAGLSSYDLTADICAIVKCVDAFNHVQNDYALDQCHRLSNCYCRLAQTIYVPMEWHSWLPISATKKLLISSKQWNNLDT